MLTPVSNPVFYTLQLLEPLRCALVDHGQSAAQALCLYPALKLSLRTWLSRAPTAFVTCPGVSVF